MRIIVDVNSDINPIILSTLWRRPWLSAFQVAIGSKIDVATATQQLQAGVMHGQVQSLSQAQSHLPAALYALTQVGAALVAPQQDWSRHAKRLQFIRQHLIVHQHINALVAALSQAIPSWQAIGDTLIPRIFQKSPLVLHGRLQLHIYNTAQPFYVLLDDGIGGPGRWAQQLRYYKRWSDQAQAQFPPLLLLCCNRFRAVALLRLALEIGLRSPAFAAWQREIAFGNGLHQCEWLTWANNGVVAALPFGTTYPIANPHAHNNISINGNLERRSKFSFINILHPTSPSLPTPNDALLSTLNTPEIHTLGFLVQHPVCPLNVIQAFTGLAEALAVDAIQKLVTLQFAAPVTLPNTQHPDSVWRASDNAVQQWAQQYGRNNTGTTHNAPSPNMPRCVETVNAVRITHWRCSVFLSVLSAISPSVTAL